MRVNVSFHNDNPKTIWNCLAAKLGREPTVDEAKAEVLRILEESGVNKTLAALCPQRHRHFQSLLDVN